MDLPSSLLEKIPQLMVQVSNITDYKNPCNVVRISVITMQIRVSNLIRLYF